MQRSVKMKKYIPTADSIRRKKKKTLIKENTCLIRLQNIASQAQWVQSIVYLRLY